MIFLFALLGICLNHAHAQTAIIIDWPTVTLPGDGILLGLTYQYEEPTYLKVNKPIDAYLGVPYAAPPVGDLRFADPAPHVIQGEYNATFDRAECQQPSPLIQLPSPPFEERDRYTDEDCLFLSIYTPSPKVTMTATLVDTQTGYHTQTHTNTHTFPVDWCLIPFI